MRKIWDIHGGVHPPENKIQSLGEPIGQIPLAKEIILPLNQHIGTPATAIVNVGEHVKKGQLIAEAQGVFSAAVHASTSGVVAEIGDRLIAHPSGLTAPCITLHPDGEDTWIELNPCENIDALSHPELIGKIQAAGLAGMGGAGFPTSVKLDPRSTDNIDTLILNGTECEPYITADDSLMQEHASEIIEGALLLARIIGNPKDILIGVEDNKPKAIAALSQAKSNNRRADNVAIVSFPTKYPSGGEKQLIQILTGREIPSGKLPANIGVLVQNVGTAYAAWRAIRYGEPLVERITTVVGKALKKERNIRVPLGTPINHVLSEHGFDAQKSSRLIVGGPMMGFAIEQDEVPVVKTTNCILVPSNDEMPDAPPAQACIRCGMCSEACPAQLLPQQLFWYAQSEDDEKLKEHNLFDCIECGACSFVCPSAIPLVQYYRSSKGRIKLQEAEKRKSDHARLRFEHRKERIEKAEAAKEAKRLARKKAAEEAKKKLTEKQESEANSNSTVNVDPVSVAQASAKANKDDPEVQRKKLNRALSSAQSRAERITKQLDENNDDPARVEKLKAQQKQNALKVKDAKDKLEAFEEAQLGSQNDNSSDLQQRIDKVAEKASASPKQAQQNAVDKLIKLLATAQQKAKEAEADGSPSAEALKLGAQKLQIKLNDAKKELAVTIASNDPKLEDPADNDAAASAIAKAQQKAAALANMSDEDKKRGQVDSLNKRIEKSRVKLAQAIEEKSEHVDVLKNSLEKLEQKLANLREN